MSKPTGTQADYANLLQSFIGQSEAIDKETPWQEREPEWWLMMMSMQREARQHLSAVKPEVQS